MARKLVENNILIFSPPPPPKKKKKETKKKNFKKNLGCIQNVLVKNEKNQGCSKLPEMVKKLVEHYFWIFDPPFKQKKI